MFEIPDGKNGIIVISLEISYINPYKIIFISYITTVHFFASVKIYKMLKKFVRVEKIEFLGKENL